MTVTETSIANDQFFSKQIIWKRFKLQAWQEKFQFKLHLCPANLISIMISLSQYNADLQPG